MKRSSFYMLAALLIAALTLVLLPTQQPAVADSHGDSKDHDVIHEAMEVLGGNFRYVNRQKGKPDMNADTADRLSKMIQAAVDSKAHLPKTATTDDLKTSYRVIMNKLIASLASAENAALQGDNEKLTAAVDELKGLKFEGHELFITEE